MNYDTFCVNEKTQARSSLPEFFYCANYRIESLNAKTNLL